MKIPDRVRIEHIKEAILEIESFNEGLHEEDFIGNSLIHSATVRQMEIIGEAAKAVSPELKEQYPDIPWRLWADFRNVLIHQYFGVDYAEVYKTMKSDLPVLKMQIEEILNSE